MPEILYNRIINNFQVIILLDRKVSDMHVTADSLGEGLSIGIIFFRAY